MIAGRKEGGRSRVSGDQVRTVLWVVGISLGVALLMMWLK